MAEECCRINLKAAADTAKRLLSNPQVVSAEVKNARLATCSACEHFNAPTKQCRLCGCYMTVKTQFSNMRCPEGRWVEET
jgi:hypothetical protein